MQEGMAMAAASSQRKTSALGMFTYSILVGLLLGFLLIYSFGLADLRADKFTMYLIALLFVLLLLPVAYYVKIFDVVEVRRDVEELPRRRHRPRRR